MAKPLIMIVDDTPENLDVLGSILVKEYKVKAALNGQRALRIAQSTPKPDMILLDIMMPEMDGYEVCRQLKADPSTAEIPIIFVTAKVQVEDEQKGLELGAVDYIIKPISPPILKERVKTHLALRLAYKKLDATNSLVMESIRYARRIQGAILPPASLLEQRLPNHFVLWEPRDVVGGDLYWCRPTDEGLLIILGDCTGHGVPGAFMTLIANGVLDQALQQYSANDPAQIISRMHKGIQHLLNQDTSEGESDDGLELGACFLPDDTNHLIFSGARFSLFYQDKDQEIVEIKGDKKGIGYRRIEADTLFTNHQIDTPDQRRFFMSSDGMIDQIGGEKRRGFGKKRLLEALTTLKEHPMAEVGQQLYQTLLTYQGEEKRRDDVCIIGFSR
ncbi:MAG: response regulator [Magnetococcales bacterium]|nr:response regulator [Magnetococcales bacterium]